MNSLADVSRVLGRMREERIVLLVPAYNDLVIDAVQNARLHDYKGIAVRVVDPDYLVALPFQAGGARRRERAWQLLQSGSFARERLRAILTKHGISAQILDDV